MSSLQSVRMMVNTRNSAMRASLSCASSESVSESSATGSGSSGSDDGDQVGTVGDDGGLVGLDGGVQTGTVA